ncbi:hypothetical protein EYF80_040026 [Liparis tanakae]|uniref:Uncharacterized protein n=1 Tax=Liparis tanakae TaxID=230148 RepID=A0A4Z2GB06_9TELE|nr:hypothetical protein EYF80_040026 [Liparis tanakae]
MHEVNCKSRAARRLEFTGVQAYGDIEGLHTLPTAMADYRGVCLCSGSILWVGGLGAGPDNCSHLKDHILPICRSDYIQSSGYNYNIIVCVMHVEQD